MKTWPAISSPDKRCHVHVWAEDLEENTRQQISNIATLPFIHHHVAVMPDAHYGIGSTVGTVIPTKKAIIPAAVGVDIGCGMMAVKTNIIADDILEGELREIRENIERSVPTGKYSHVNPYEAKSRWCFARQSEIGYFRKQSEPESFWDIKAKKWQEQLGTLGSGNHFIEICLDENDEVWVMLHSGSRGVGNAIGRKFIDRAKEDMITYHIADQLVDPNLAYLSEGTANFKEYWDALNWTQEYASLNRRIMMNLVFEQLERVYPKLKAGDEVVNCHHNYTALENHYGENVYVTRKGAIRARGRDLGIIPGSMGTRSYIVRGKGKQESFHSCSHGAGRAMSRRAAKDKFTLSDLDAQTRGVEIRRRQEIVDEIPGAYKDIDRVMELQKDLVEPVHTLKQIICVKGD